MLLFFCLVRYRTEVAYISLSNFITSTLNLNDDSIFDIHTVKTNDGFLHIHITLKDTHPLCPYCSGRSTVKGYKTRTYNHLPLAGFPSLIVWNRRRYRCKDCLRTFSEENPFGPETFHQSYAVLSSIALDLRNIHYTFFDIAKAHHVSEPLVMDYLDSFLTIPRLPLPQSLGIDEIHSHMSNHYGGSYLCVLVDNQNRRLVDILPDRSKRTLSNYFKAIPLSERRNVRYVTMDMWESYKEVAQRFLPNAIIAVDPFHVIEHLVKDFTQLRVTMMNQSVYHSSTYYLLKKWHKLLLKDMDLDNEPQYNAFFHQKLNYRDLYNRLLAIHPTLKTAYELKELYRRFNKIESFEMAAERFDTILDEFKKADIPYYVEFVQLCCHWKQEIINSFLRPYNQRKLSNALAESMNEKLRTLIDISSGYSNFERFRARALYCLNDRVFYVLTDHLHRKKREGKKRGIYKKKTSDLSEHIESL